jgi:hypothetical protein
MTIELADELRHLGAEFRIVRGMPDAAWESHKLKVRLARTLLETYNACLLPDSLHEAVETQVAAFGEDVVQDPMKLGQEIAIRLCHDEDTTVEWIIGYRTLRHGPSMGDTLCYVFSPAAVSTIWPKVFKDVMLFVKDESEEELSRAIDEVRFTLIGYFASACELLGEWIENHRDGEPSESEAAMGTAALDAVVAGGLAGVLQAAVGTRAVDRVSAVMRERLAKDQSLYAWSQRDWASELGVSTKTINKCDAWREVKQWNAANKAQRISKAVSKETRK